MSHTPGPWTVVPLQLSEGWYIAELDDGALYTNEADARLIASAPDLLAALENIAPLMGEVRCEIHGRRVLTDVEPPSMGCDGCLYVSLSSTGDRDARVAIAKAIGTEVSA